MYDKAIDNISKMGLEDKIQVVHANATEYLSTIEDKDGDFDVVFIDAAKGQYMIFLEQAIRLVKNGGVIIADNVLFKGRVLSDYNEHKHRTAVNRLREYISYIKTDERLNSTVLDVGDGVAISVVNK
ncbi:putative O-methyltransferase [compost metagenome]